MSIKSMTGFGQAEAPTPSGTYRVEVRSVNNRFLDLQLKQPKSLASIEARIKQTVSAAVSRGSVTVAVTCNGEESKNSFTWDRASVENYLRIFREVKDTFGLKGDITLSDLLAFSDFIKVQSADFDEETVWTHVGPLVTAALKDFEKSRGREGLLLAQDIRKTLKAIEQTTKKVEKRAPARLKEYRAALTARVQEVVTTGVDPARIAQEVALMADRLDISEECVRLSAHLEKFGDTLEAEEPVGKRMNFILQEMNREANTIGSKANDAQIANLSVQLKEYVERIREQIQNIE
jgi:uncharacterized protein (TIGR00255 family)